MYKLVIFDLDGTLLDTLPDLQAVLNFCLKMSALPEISLDDTKKFIGNGAKKLVERAVGVNNASIVEEVYRNYNKCFAQCDNSLTRLFDGVDGLLKRLKDLNIKLTILSNKPQYGVNSAYQKFLSEYRFDAVLGQADGVPLKPDPSVTLEIINNFGLRREECLFVGDGETDVLTAKNAGVNCVSVLWGYRTLKQLEEVGAKTFVKDCDELLNLIIL